MEISQCRCGMIRGSDHVIMGRTVLVHLGLAHASVLDFFVDTQGNKISKNDERLGIFV